MKGITLLVFVLFFSITLFGQDGYKVGDMARDFSLKNVNGKMVSLSELKNNSGAIVIFSCNHCPFSVFYEDRIIDLAGRYKKTYPVIVINPNDPEIQPDDSYENMIIRAKEKKFNFPYLVDETQEIAKAYGATRTPHVYLLRKENEGYRVAYIGAIDDNSRNASEVNEKYLENAIAAIESGISPDPDFTKAIGCTIKWRKTDQ
jgi:alkyl hydroperoxide reductase subunit AhpC